MTKKLNQILDDQNIQYVNKKIKGENPKNILEYVRASLTTSSSTPIKENICFEKPTKATKKSIEIIE